MYLKTKCPICGEGSFHCTKLHRRRVFVGYKKISWVTAAEVTDTCSPEELATLVLHELAGHVYDGYYS
jgi:phage FluMu protein Com